MKMDMLTNATVVDDAIRFVSQKLKEKSSYNSNEHDKESKERDYDEDEDQLEEEQEEEGGKTTGEISATAINRVF
jgi:hypothetical protein